VSHQDQTLLAAIFGQGQAGHNDWAGDLREGPKPGIDGKRLVGLGRISHDLTKKVEGLNDYFLMMLSQV
jgi:hypothetical protein